MSRIVLAVIAVVVIVAGGLFVFSSGGGLTGQSEKEKLVNALFAPQITQVEMLGDQLARQFAAYQEANEDLPAKKAAKAQALIQKAENNMRRAVRDTLMETYTRQELEEKQTFENSELAEELAGKERQVMSMMHVIGKNLGREAILRSVEKEFSEEQSAALRKTVERLTSNVEMPDADRAALIADKLDMAQEQAGMMLNLLSVKQADAVKEQKLLDYSQQNIPDDKLALAREYVQLTQLDAVFSDTVEDMVKDANLEDGFQQAKAQMVAGVANLYEKETLDKATDYFSQDIVQRVLAKDIEVARKISPRIQEEMQTLNEKLAQIVEGS